jgi:hypothetical protein
MALCQLRAEVCLMACDGGRCFDLFGHGHCLYHAFLCFKL